MNNYTDSEIEPGLQTANAGAVQSAVVTAPLPLMEQDENQYHLVSQQTGRRQYNYSNKIITILFCNRNTCNRNNKSQRSANSNKISQGTNLANVLYSCY